jgi:hypothetical protein
MGRSLPYKCMNLGTHFFLHEFSANRSKNSHVYIVFDVESKKNSPRWIALKDFFRIFTQGICRNYNFNVNDNFGHFSLVTSTFLSQLGPEANYRMRQKMKFPTRNHTAAD